MMASLDTEHSSDEWTTINSTSTSPSLAGNLTNDNGSLSKPSSFKVLIKSTRETHVAIVLARVHVLVQLKDYKGAEQALDRALSIANELESELLEARCRFWNGVMLVTFHNDKSRAVKNFIDAKYLADKDCPESRLLLAIYRGCETWVEEYFSKTTQSPEKAEEFLQEVKHLTGVVLGGNDSVELEDRWVNLHILFGGNYHSSDGQEPQRSLIAARSDLLDPTDLETYQLISQQLHGPPYEYFMPSIVADEAPLTYSPGTFPPQSARTTASARAFVGIDEWEEKQKDKVWGEDREIMEKANAANMHLAEFKARYYNDTFPVAQDITTRSISQATQHPLERQANSPVDIEKPANRVAEIPGDAILSDTLALDNVQERIEVTTGRRQSISGKVTSPLSPVPEKRPAAIGQEPPRRRMSTDPPSPSPLRKCSVPE